MKVLFQNRHDMFEFPGGDVVQLLKTKSYLENLGVEVDISTELNPDLKNYDLIHLFNITSSVGDTYYQLHNAIIQGKKIVISPIYWNMDEAEELGYRNPILRFKNRIIRREKLNAFCDYYIYKLLKKGINNTIKLNKKHSLKSIRHKILNNSNIILPNSYMEADLIKKDFGINDNFAVIPNAVDLNVLNFDSSIVYDALENIDDFLLCVGCIDPRKNQLSLLNAIKNEDIHLVFVGRVPESKYANLCMGLAKKCTGKIIFLGEVDHEKLGSIYSRAKAYVQPSWYETPGLASMEAAIFECNIISTNRGSTTEYFKDMALYCDPSSLASIHDKVIEALHSKRSRRLKRHIMKNYTWDITSKKTLESYESIIK